MKKVLLTMILFISSFFFFNLNVNAAYYDRDVTDDNIALINEEFFDFRNQVLEFTGESKIYIIYYISGEYRAIIADNDSSYSLKFGGFNYNCWFVVNGFDIYLYKNGNLTLDSSITSDTNISIIKSSSTPSFLFLDTNVDTSSLASSVPFGSYYRVTYNSSTYYLPNSSLYSIYLKNFVPPEPDDPYEEEKTLLSSFYTCVIEKLSYLTNAFVTNYIFLTILGVFILIYVIELFRRLLR